MANTMITAITSLLGMAVHFVTAGVINNQDKIEWTARRLLSNATETEPEKTIWQKIEEFYDDKNNFAMYMVLPCIVLVYGGCSVIYCIAKCRQFFKKKKKAPGLPHQEDDGELDCDDIQTTNNNARQEEGATRPGSKARSTSDVRVGVEREQSTPLPWQVPDNDDVEKNDAKEAKPKTPMNNQHSSPPPPYDDEIGAAAPIPKKQPMGEKPVISSVSNRGNDMAYNNAKYAAMLLRLDEHNRGRSGFKDAGRRLVFIAE